LGLPRPSARVSADRARVSGRRWVALCEGRAAGITVPTGHPERVGRAAHAAGGRARERGTTRSASAELGGRSAGSLGLRCASFEPRGPAEGVGNHLERSSVPFRCGTGDNGRGWRGGGGGGYRARATAAQRKRPRSLASLAPLGETREGRTSNSTASPPPSGSAGPDERGCLCKVLQPRSKDPNPRTNRVAGTPSLSFPNSPSGGGSRRGRGPAARHEGRSRRGRREEGLEEGFSPFLLPLSRLPPRRGRSAQENH